MARSDYVAPVIVDLGSFYERTLEMNDPTYEKHYSPNSDGFSFNGQPLSYGYS